jgi:hypothetical protein
MRIETVEASNYNQAKKLMPWASRIAKVCGQNNKIAYKGFESIDDYKIWKNQK